MLAKRFSTSLQTPLAGKGAAAPAPALDVGVVDGETGTHEAVHVVELRARDVRDAHRVDEHPDALGFEDLVVVGDVDDGCFLLLHQHLPCCSLLLFTEIITSPTVYFNATFVRFGEVFHAAPCRVASSWRRCTSSTWRAARMGSRPREPFSSVAGARRLARRPCKRRLRGHFHHPRSRGDPSMPGRTAPSGPPPRLRPRRGSAPARWG